MREIIENSLNYDQPTNVHVHIRIGESLQAVAIRFRGHLPLRDDYTQAEHIVQLVPLLAALDHLLEGRRRAFKAALQGHLAGQ